MDLQCSTIVGPKIIICWTNSQDPRVDVFQGFHIGPANDDQVRGTYLAYGISLDLSSDLKR